MTLYVSGQLALTDVYATKCNELNTLMEGVCMSAYQA